MDALFADGNDGNSIASDELNIELEGETGPFSNVRLIFASHFHEDHMKGKAILRHLRANDKAVALMPEQARTLIMAAGIRPNEEDRIISPKINIGERRVMGDLPFPVTLYGINHGKGRRIENIGMAVTIGNKIFMHVGDMDTNREDLIIAGIDKAEIDYLLMPFWQLQGAEGIEMIKSTFNAKHIIPMHFPLEDSDWMIGMGGLKSVKEKAYSSLNNIMKLDQEMTCIGLD